MLMPAMRAMVFLQLFNQPWRCLWRGSVQITRTTPLRRMILQLRHIFLTDAATFMLFSWPLAGPPFHFVRVPSRSLGPEHDAGPSQVIGCQLDRHLVAGQDADVVHAHLSGDVAEHDVPVFQLHTER